MQKISISYRVFFFAIFQPADFKFLFCNIEKTMKTFALSSIKLVFHRRKCLVSKPQKHRDKAGNSLHTRLTFWKGIFQKFKSEFCLKFLG